MFDQTFVNSQAQTRRPWTVALSLGLQTALVAALLIVPLLHIAKLEAPPKVPLFLTVEKVTLAAKPEVLAAAHTSLATRPVLRPIEVHDSVPVRPTIAFGPDAPDLPAASFGAGGSPGIALTALLPDAIIQPPRPQPVKPAPAVAPTPVRVGGGVQAAKLLFGPKPAYPPLARATRTQGTVKIMAVIARDGTIRNLQVSSGPPLLVKAAMDAVQQWRYQATLLNNEPVEVITEIDVTFTLGQ